MLCCWLFLTGPESNKLLYVMIRNRNLGFRFIACCRFNEPNVNGEKNRPHLNILISFTGRRLTQRGWARRGLKSYLTPPLPVHAHCATLNWAWSLPEIVTSKSQIRDVLGNGADRFSTSSSNVQLFADKNERQHILLSYFKTLFWVWIAPKS